MRFIGRVFVIFFAFLLACLAAGVTMAFGLLGSAWHMDNPDPVVRGMFWVITVIGTSFAGTASFMPLLLLVILAEAFRWRSVLLYALAGVVIAVMTSYAWGVWNPYEESIDYPGPVASGIEVIFAAGVVFGLAYWAIAGRKAGAWLEPRR